MARRWLGVCAAVLLAACGGGGADSGAAGGASGGAGGRADGGPSGGQPGGGGGAGGAATGADAGGPGPAGPTWYADVAPLLHQKCLGCHRDGGIGPFPLVDYASAKAEAHAIAIDVASRTMPPWGAYDTDDCHPRLPFASDLRLSDAQIAMLQAWDAAGAPEGAPVEMPDDPPPAFGHLRDADVAVQPVAPFAVSGLQDEFRCFVLDPHVDATRYVNGVAFVPGDTSVVHHALLFLDTDRESLGKMDADGGYPCFGGPELSNTQLVAAWAPGGLPTEFPADAGMALPAGAVFVMQVHYHPAGRQASDATGIELRFTAGVPEFRAETALVGNFDRQSGADGLQPDPDDRGGVEFRVPAGARSHVETMRYTVPNDLDGKPFPGVFLSSVATHMHYVGRDARITLRRPPRAAACDAQAVGPLRDCVAANCPDLAGQAVVQCATDHCGAFIGGLSRPCTDCLTQQVQAGAADAFGPCEQPPGPPTQYGPLPDQPADECLLETPSWDFDWQRFYTYDVPVTSLPLVQAGDVLEIRCVYDNSMDNPFVRRALAEQHLDRPRDVSLGETTLDEMCLGAFTLLYKEAP